MAHQDTPEPFKVDIPERALIDLDERLTLAQRSAIEAEDPTTHIANNAGKGSD